MATCSSAARADEETAELVTSALLEFTDSRGVQLRIDRERGIVQGVKVLGAESKNGRTYTRQAMQGAIPLYENAKVNIDHPAGSPSSSRGYRDRFGTLKNVREGVFGLHGDLHFNPKHALAEQFLWDAEHAPENVGLSHNVAAKTRTERGRVVVEEITHVQSVDLVADPATSRGLFEGVQESEKEKFVAITLEAVKADKAILESLKSEILQEAAQGDAAKAQAAELKALKEQVDQYKAKEAVAGKRAKVDAILAEAKLPKEAVSEVFLEQLLGAADEAGIKKLVEDRAAIIKGVKLVGSGSTPPQSKDQQLVEGEGGGAVPSDVKQFASMLHG